MNSAVKQYRLHLKNWRLLIFSFGYVALVLGVAVFGFYRTGGATPINLLLLVVTVSSLAFFLASAQQEMLHCSLTFLLPGFRRGVQRNQILTTILVGVITFVVTYLFPMTYGLEANSFVHGWSYACLAAALFASVVLLVLRFPYSSYFSFVGFWVVFLLIKLWMRVSGEAVGLFLDQVWLISGVSGLILFLVWRDLAQAGMHRQLIERPYLSVTDLANPTRTMQFKEAMSKRKGKRESGSRSSAGLITWARENAGRSQAEGRSDKAGLWEAIYLFLATSIPRSRALGVLLVLSMYLVVLVTGYYDARNSHHDDGGMTGWFAGLAFQMIMVPTLVFYYIRTRPLGLLRSRRSLERSGYLGTGIILLLGLVCGGILWGVFQLHHLVMPLLTIGDRHLASSLPQMHNLFLPLLVTPFVLLVAILWPRKGSVLVIQQAGVMYFFLVQGLFSLVGSQVVLWPLVGFTAVLWLVLPFVWHWRVWKTDSF